MHVLTVGLNHKSAPIEIRERVAIPRERLSDALARFGQQLGECVILSTCNRTEIYSVPGNSPGTTEHIRRLLGEYHNLDAEELRPYLYEYTDADAARHLFRVTSGLDSIIVGEPQIMGQVRTALAAASESQSVGVSLKLLFRAAI